MKRSTSSTCVALIAASVGWPGTVLADETSAQHADRLFNEANHLADQGNFAEACPRYDESNRLDPAIGTQFNLADCYEHTGRTASALAEFRQVEKVAGMAGKTERQKSAHRRAEALEGTVARIRIVVPPAVVDLPGLDVRSDDKPVERGDLGNDFPVDPGPHTLAAKAPGRPPWSQVLVVGEHQSLTVTVVLPEPPPSSPVSRIAAPTRSRSRVLLAGIAGGVGVAGLLVGSVTGVVSIVQHSKYTAACPTSTCSSSSAVSESDLAVATGNASTVGFIVGGAGIAAGAILFFTAPTENSRAAAWRVVPSLGPGSAGVTLDAAF